MRDDPDQLVLLLTTPTEFEARAIASSLESEGIATHVFAASAQGVSWQGGIANGVRVMVRRKDAAVAEEALYRARQASRAIDWSSVDVGEAEDETAAEIARSRGGRRGKSVWAWRIRVAGMLCISTPFLLNMVGTQNAPLALAVLVLLMIVSWNPPTPEGNSGRRGGGTRAVMSRRG